MIGTHFMMRPLISLTYLRNKREGDFRFSHARLREYAESIVFYNGQVSTERQVTPNGLFKQNQSKSAALMHCIIVASFPSLYRFRMRRHDSLPLGLAACMRFTNG